MIFCNGIYLHSRTSRLFSISREKLRLRVLLTLLALVGVPIPAASMDIKAYGACQGAADDSAAIQQAVDAAAASATDNTVTFSCMAPVGNGVVVSRDRNAVHAVHIVAGPASGIKATAVPKGATKSAGSGGPATLLLSACHDCSVTGLTFDGNEKGTILLGIVNSERVSVLKNSFSNAGSATLYAPAVVYAIGNRDNLYSGNMIRNTYGRTRGFWVGNTGGGSGEAEVNPTISDNSIRATAATGIATVTVGGRIIGNYVSDTGGAGIVIASTADVSSRDVTVENNRVYRNRYHGIQSDAIDSRTVNVFLRNNISNENNGAGIYIVNASNWTVTGNIVQDNNFSGAQYAPGIVVQSANDILIRDNVISDTRSGLRRTQHDGISVSGRLAAGNVRNVTMEGNVIRNHLANGIVVNSSPNSQGGTVNNVVLGSNSLDGNEKCRIRMFEQGSGSVSNVFYLGHVVNIRSTGNVCDSAVPSP